MGRFVVSVCLWGWNVIERDWMFESAAYIDVAFEEVHLFCILETPLLSPHVVHHGDQLLRMIFKKEWVDLFQQQHPDSYVSLLNAFKVKKEAVCWLIQCFSVYWMATLVCWLSFILDQITCSMITSIKTGWSFIRWGARP